MLLLLLLLKSFDGLYADFLTFVSGPAILVFEYLQLIDQIEEFFERCGAEHLLLDHLLDALEAFLLIHQQVEASFLDHALNDGHREQSRLPLEELLDEASEEADDKLADLTLTGEAHLEQLKAIVVCLGGFLARCGSRRFKLNRQIAAALSILTFKFISF